jgi:hypothetical protein
MRSLVSSLLLAGLLWAVPARAADATSTTFETHPVAVYALAGLGAPLGWGGLEVEATAASHLAISAGVGEGFSGLQIGVMPRLRFAASSRQAYTVGLGFSNGDYQQSAGASCFISCTPTVYKGNVTWANLEAGIEARQTQGFSLRLFGGLALPFMSELTCVQPGDVGCGTQSADTLIYLGAGIGFAP